MLIPNYSKYVASAPSPSLCITYTPNPVYTCKHARTSCLYREGQMPFHAVFNPSTVCKALPRILVSLLAWTLSVSLLPTPPPLYVHTQIDKYTCTHIYTRNQAQQEPPTSYTHNARTQNLRSHVLAFLQRVTTLLRRGGACACV